MKAPAFRGAALMLAAVVWACGKSDGKSAANARTSAALPGALPKSVDAMTGDELFAFAHGLRFVGGAERRRRCRGRPQCRGSAATQSTSIRVDAVDTQDSISAAGTPANGVIAARALNRGQVADTMYGTRPGGYEYYLIVQPGAGGGMTWRLEELATTGGARAHRRIAAGRVRECGHPFVHGARADFKSCNEAAAQIRPAAFTGFSIVQTDGESPIWFACSQGCCTAGPPDGSS